MLFSEFCYGEVVLIAGRGRRAVQVEYTELLLCISTTSLYLQLARCYPCSLRITECVLDILPAYLTVLLTRLPEKLTRNYFFMSIIIFIYPVEWAGVLQIYGASLRT